MLVEALTSFVVAPEHVKRRCREHALFSQEYQHDKNIDHDHESVSFSTKVYPQLIELTMLPSTDDSIPDDGIGAELDSEISSLQAQSKHPIPNYSISNQPQYPL
jgi:hypothetical protein